MEILIIVASYYPLTDGVQNVTQYQAEGLVRLGHEVSVLTSCCAGKKRLREYEEHNGVKIQRLYAFKEMMINFGDKSFYQHYLTEHAQRFDIVMTTCPTNWSTDWALPLIKNLPCATMMMVHGIHDFRWNNFHDKSLYGIARKIWGDLRWPLYWKFNWKKIKQFGAIAHLHENDFAAQYFRKNGVTNEHILYNAVDDEFFENEFKENQIINVGTYCSLKNQIYCLTVFYKSNLTNWKLVLIGSSKNKYYEKVLQCRQRLEKIYGHREVDILVAISREETIKAIKESKIYLLTSISEMFPVSLIESMAAGCAWVSTDVGIVRNLPGGIVNNKLEEIVNSLEKLAENNTWLSYGEIGKKFALENCKKDTQVRRLEEILINTVMRNKEKS